MNAAETPYQAATQAPPPPGHETRAYSAFHWSEDLRRKSPILAGVLSLLPGLGQVYLGYYQQGFINMLIVGSTISLLQRDLGTLAPLFGFFLTFFWLFNIIDATRRAMFYNEIMAGSDPKEFTENFRMPGSQGSLVGGVVLIALGGIALSNTLFDIPLDWLDEWWPLALVIGGVLLLLQSQLQKDRKPGANESNSIGG